MVKQLYNALAMLALINMLAMLGLFGFLFHKGKLNAEKVNRLAAVIRGEIDTTAASTEGALASATARPEDVAESSSEKIKQALEEGEIKQLRLEREEQDLKHRQNLLDRRMITFQRDKDEHTKQVQEQEQMQKKKQEQALSSSYLEVVSAIENIKPVAAVEVLMTKGDPDCVKILQSMDEMKRTKIFNACKTAEQKAWRDRVITQMLKQPVAVGTGGEGTS